MTNCKNCGDNSFYQLEVGRRKCNSCGTVYRIKKKIVNFKSDLIDAYVAGLRNPYTPAGIIIQDPTKMLRFEYHSD